MNRDTSSARPPSQPRRKTPPRRAAKQADRHHARASGGAHNFKATIEALSLMTDSLPTLVSD